MDITEDEPDVKLQHDSAELVSELDASLQPMLWKTSKSGKKTLRARVRDRDLSKLLNIIDKFQELPQLLDTHLQNFISVLADSLLVNLRSPPVLYSKKNALLLVPTSTAVCKLLYRFCKVRGEKVIVRFVSTKVKHIELLISALEERVSKQNDTNAVGAENWQANKENISCWEETYFLLLWLSQLILAPFDLVSISSDISHLKQSEVKGLTLPTDSPKIAIRIVPLAIHCLFLPGKEKDAAKSLLARLALRKDMQCNGTTNALIKWSLSQLRPDPQIVTHQYLGVLSFLTGILSLSVGTKDMERQIFAIYEIVQQLSTSSDKQLKDLNSNSVARKLIIKILRSVALISFQCSQEQLCFQMIESVIGYMLEAVSDPATPVRLAASKALSVITLKLTDEMCDEVIQCILSELNENLMWIETSRFCRPNYAMEESMRQYLESSAEISNENLTSNGTNTKWIEVEKFRNLDLSRVNTLMWHGIMMTLSYLVYKRSIKSSNLSSAISALRLGLLFEQRSTTGNSVGTFVRDAACFGIWSLARRYTTTELQHVVIKKENKILYLNEVPKSTLQILALDLLISATLDPAGNIRRGASAALQELIGRHPNTIEKGIELVQIVDYHSIALRMRAIEVVALDASSLSDQYETAILENLFGWLGIRNSDKSVRRVVATVIGKLIWAKQSRTGQLHTESLIFRMIDRIVSEILLLKPRQADERHGLILTFNEIIKIFVANTTKECLVKELYSIQLECKRSLEPILCEKKSQELSYLEISPKESPFLFLVRCLLRDIISILTHFNLNQSSYRAPKLSFEAIGQLLISGFQLAKIDLIFREIENRRFMRQTSPTLINENAQKLSLNLLQTLDIHYSLSTTQQFKAEKQYEVIVAGYRMTNGPPKRFMKLAKDSLNQLLGSSDKELVNIISTAAADFGLLSGPDTKWFPEWNRKAFKAEFTGRNDQYGAYIYTMFRFPTSLYHLWNNSNESFAGSINRIWHKIRSIDIRVMMMRYLSSSFAIRECLLDYSDLIKTGLDDYTTTYQGDVGSLVRIESIKAVAIICEQKFAQDQRHIEKEMSEIFDQLVPRLLRLAAERLDRVRIEAKKSLVFISSLKSKSLQIFSRLTSLFISSKAYYQCLLEIQCNLFPPSINKHLFNHFLSGYVTSADRGSEDVISASRSAIVNFCSDSSAISHDSADSSSINSNNDNSNDSYIFTALLQVISSRSQRICISALEILAFLISLGRFDRQALLKGISILDEVDKILVKRVDNIRQIEASIKLFGAFLMIEGPCCLSTDTFISFRERVIYSLTQTLIHQYPKIRNITADEIFFRTGYGKGVDWISEIRLSEMETIRQSLLNSNVLEVK
ncbi:Tubulin-specific chaperone D [Erysiphe neolycopersici]|uniref:Tubulin-specific chaperone D n=1 Tax=Erysiphe neolycopersici TaxID=212602 RepID=A0A420HRV5_9PEZI|nr:Tubulin-specific chaperone D [Erysiphe neolycopersici]